jgi:hypothetical protein
MLWKGMVRLAIGADEVDLQTDPQHSEPIQVRREVGEYVVVLAVDVEFDEVPGR